MLMKMVCIKMTKSIKIQVILTLILSCLMLSACDDGLRKAPYSKQDMEEYLEDVYEEDLVILSRTEIYDPEFGTLQKVEYEIGYADGREETFYLIDMHDGGFAGWNVNEYIPRDEE